MATTASAFRSQETRAPRRPDRAIATSESNGYKPSYVPAAIAAGLVFILYLVTLAPSVAMWDTGEYMAAVKVLGIPHPPGNPFFVLLGHAFASLPIPVSYAAKINIMAALASALSAGFWFLITERIVARWIADRWQRIVSSYSSASARPRLLESSSRIPAAACGRYRPAHDSLAYAASLETRARGARRHRARSHPFHLR